MVLCCNYISTNKDNAMNNKHKLKVMGAYLQFLESFQAFNSVLEINEVKGNAEKKVYLSKLLTVCEVMIAVFDKLGNLVHKVYGDCIIGDKK